MKRLLVVALLSIVAVALAWGEAHAISSQYQRKGTATQTGQQGAKTQTGEAQTKSGGLEFPDKGWHKGFYITADVGMMQVTNDSHVVTGRKFDGTFDIAYGLTFGWDIADWIGPMVQMIYATTTSTVGDGTVTYPNESARQHVLDFGIFARGTLPYFTRASWQPRVVKIIPYAKLGGVGHALFVNAPTNANKVGGFGGGAAVGAGCELFIWKGFFVAVDFTESFIIQQAYYLTINNANTKVTDGGLKPQFMLLGMFGWHF